MSSQSARQINALQAVGLLMSFVLVAVVGGVLSAGLVMPAVATASAVTDTSVSLFDELPTELATPPLSERSEILAADGTLLAEFYTQNRIVVSLDEISQPMIDAVIDVEDRRFYEHGGVDLTGMTRAMLANALTDETQGASTLTQQYIKNMLIQQALTLDDAEQAQAIAEARDASGIEGYARKLREAKLAVSLEQRMTKDEILAGYLNIAQFGAQVYGVEAAALHFFSVHASELNYLQAATIAGITKSPIAYDPERDPEESQARRDVVLWTMYNEGDISQEEYDTGVATPIADTLSIGATKLGCAAADASVPGAAYFCDYVTKIIAQNEVFGPTPEDRSRNLYQGGLVIHTTLDPARQAIAQSTVMGSIPPDDPSGVSTAMSVVEPGTGAIIAMAQNRVYDTHPDPPVGHTSVNYNTDHNYGGSNGFMPGSTFKPFTLLQWFKEGHSLSEVVDGKVRQWKMSDFSASCTGLGNSTWKPNNAEGGGSFMTVQQATMNSVNNAFVDMASQVDLCGIFAGAEELGVHRAYGKEIPVLPAGVLGTNEVAPLTMAAAYAAFAADGVFCDPIAITAIEDRDGNALDVPSANCRQAISPQLAAAMAYGLSKVWQGTASNISRLPDGRPASGKTGTTSYNEHTWFAGFTRQMSTAVWVGYSEGNIRMQYMTIGGRYYRHVYGSSIAAPEWRAFMAPASEGMPVEGFPSPNSDYTQGIQVGVPAVAGNSVATATALLRDKGFHVTVESAPVYSDQPAGTVASTNPGSGSTATKGTLVTIYVSKGPEPAPEPPPAPGPPDPIPDPGPGPGGGGGGGGGTP